MKSYRKKIIILTLKRYLSSDVKSFLRARYNCTFIDRPSKNFPIEKIDLILFCGGKDINPSLYGEKPHNMTLTNNTRDIREFYVFNNYPFNIPRLGICRGAQLSCVASGGKLIQHVRNHTYSHRVKTKDGDSFNVTSTHHQMMNPFKMALSSYDIIAKSFKKESFNYYKNGNDDQWKLPHNFVEPEIVYFKKTNSLAIQGHPEKVNASTDFQEYTYELINKLLLNEL